MKTNRFEQWMDEHQWEVVAVLVCVYLLLILTGCTTGIGALHAQHENREFMATHHTFEPGGYWVPNDVGTSQVKVGQYTNLGMVSQIWVQKLWPKMVQQTNVWSFSATSGECLEVHEYTGDWKKDSP